MIATQKWINLAAFLVMVGVNALANILPLGGNTSGSVSHMYPSFFTPAGITFAIWSVIYVLLGITVVWSIFDKSQIGNDLVQSVGMWFTISCALNIAWIFSWHYRQIPLSTILIVALAAVLFIIMSKVRTSALASASIGLYTGWITVATIAAVYVMAVSLGWNGIGGTAEFWTMLGLISGAIIVSAVVYMTGNNMFALAALWAYAGIIIEHVTTYHNAHPFIIVAAAASILLIAGTAVYAMILSGTFFLVQTGNQSILQKY